MGNGIKEPISIRNAIESDLHAVISLDNLGSKDEKPAYWAGVFQYYFNSHKNERHFLIAESNGLAVGFIIAEVRAWEFGSPPCGWVFALAVSPIAREVGIGQRMFQEISLRLKQVGVTNVRTMVDRDNKLLLCFFRGMGLSTGKYLELERAID